MTLTIKQKIKIVKDTVTLAEVFRKLPKTLKTQKVPLMGHLTLNSMLQSLQGGEYKNRHLALELNQKKNNVSDIK